MQVMTISALEQGKNVLVDGSLRDASWYLSYIRYTHAFICIYVYTHTHTYIPTHTHTHTYIYVYTYACIHVFFLPFLPNSYVFFFPIQLYPTKLDNNW